MNAESSEKKEKSKVKTPSTSGGKACDNVLELVGGTPLVKLSRFAEKHKLESKIYAKLEFMNPAGSIKDRVALAFFDEAERSGAIKPGKTILIEPTSGNMGVSLAMLAAFKGYKLILTLPESVPLERRKLLSHLGAELILIPADKGMKGAVEMAKTMMNKSKEEMFMFNQFENPAGVKAHEETTAEEIWNDMNGDIDILVCGVGSGATITGISAALRKKKNGFRAFAVEPSESAVLSGGKPSQHKIQGIGAGFIPPILDKKVVDGIVKVTSERAFETARDVTKTEGIAAGISSGAALAAAMDVARIPENKGKKIVVIFPSGAERYLSSPLFMMKS